MAGKIVGRTRGDGELRQARMVSRGESESMITWLSELHTLTCSYNSDLASDRRAGRGEYQAASNSRETRRDRDAGDSRGTGRSSRPAWMNDDAQPSGSAPAWMDEPTGGIVSFDGGRVLDKPEATDGMDSIQAWKKQMKDMERRGKGLGLEETVNKSGPVASEGPASSVFANLVRKPEVNHAEPGHAADSAGNSVASQGKEGGRASRFAKFFDGKPAPAPASPPPQQSPTPQAQPPQSIFETLLGGSSANKPSSSPGPSKEDSESMARLLGMLQMSSGVRSFLIHSHFQADDYLLE